MFFFSFSRWAFSPKKNIHKYKFTHTHKMLPRFSSLNCFPIPNETKNSIISNINSTKSLGFLNPDIKLNFSENENSRRWGFFSLFVSRTYFSRFHHLKVYRTFSVFQSCSAFLGIREIDLNDSFSFQAFFHVHKNENAFSENNPVSLSQDLKGFLIKNYLRHFLLRSFVIQYDLWSKQCSAQIPSDSPVLFYSGQGKINFMIIVSVTFLI